MHRTPATRARRANNRESALRPSRSRANASAQAAVPGQLASGPAGGVHVRAETTSPPAGRGQPIQFIPNPRFGDAESLQAYVDDALPAHSAAGLPTPPAGTPAFFAQLYATPLLTADEELRLFRRMNALKCRASTIQAAFDTAGEAAAQVAQIERLLAQAVEVRDRIVSANLRLVVSIARRLSSQPDAFDDLVSDGSLTLIVAAEKFDFARGYRFSTYATHAIQREFFRVIRKRRVDRARLVENLDALALRAAARGEADPASGQIARRRDQLLRLIDGLGDRERLVLTLRFGLDGGVPRTLQVISRQLGVSKERVRQLELRALKALQRAAVP